MGTCEPTRYRNSDFYRDAIRSSTSQTQGCAVLTTLAWYYPAGRPFFFPAILYATVLHPCDGIQDNVTARRIMSAKFRRANTTPGPHHYHPTHHQQTRTLHHHRRHSPARPLRHITQLRCKFGAPSWLLLRATCGRPYTTARTHGRYIWEGRRARHLCVRWGKERALTDERHLACGVSQWRLALFLDFIAMWVAGYARGGGPVFGELGQMGVDLARGRPTGSVSNGWESAGA